MCATNNNFFPPFSPEDVDTESLRISVFVYFSRRIESVGVPSPELTDGVNKDVPYRCHYALLSSECSASSVDTRLSLSLSPSSSYRAKWPGISLGSFRAATGETRSRNETRDGRISALRCQPYCNIIQTACSWLGRFVVLFFMGF